MSKYISIIQNKCTFMLFSTRGLMPHSLKMIRALSSSQLDLLRKAFAWSENVRSKTSLSHIVALSRAVPGLSLPTKVAGVDLWRTEEEAVGYDALRHRETVDGRTPLITIAITELRSDSGACPKSKNFLARPLQKVVTQ